VFVVVTLTFVDVVAVPLNVVAVIEPLDGFIVTVDTVEVAAPDTVVVAGVNIIGWLALVEASVTSTFLPVVAVPVTLPVRLPVTLPEKAPLNVVADIVPDDGLTLTVETVDVAAPDTDVVAGVNIIGWLLLAEVINTSTFLPVVAVPVTLPVRLPVTLPEKAPLNVVAEIVPDDGFTLTVDTVDVAAPDTDVVAGVNMIG